jgi:UDP-N-acetylmuramoyl-tripeptide--D-alanyl-D-alanine ligase
MIRFVLKNLQAMYGPRSPQRLVALYRQARGPFVYLGRYWSTQNFATYAPDRSKYYRTVVLLLGVGMILQIAVGLSFVYAGLAYEAAGNTLLGIALLMAYPLIWAHTLFLLAFCWQLLHPKRYGKALIATMLERQVRQLRRQNEFTLIAVVGSVGKTSTKLAVARLLEQHKRVRYQEGNYNDRVTVPLVLFNVTQPNIYNVVAWTKIYLRNRRKLLQPYPFDVVVVELGIDGPGQMKDFAYLRPDLTVVTSVAEEHMEYFKTLDVVAREELAVFDFSTQVLVNVDDVSAQYLEKLSYESYGLSKQAHYRAEVAGAPAPAGQKMVFDLHETKLTVQSRYYGQQGAKILVAAAAIAHMLEIAPDKIQTGLEKLAPFSGRLQLLPGVQDATLLDDTYNASPLAVRAALDVLYAMEAPQRIAILGSMNELGDTSATAHAQIGAYCDPDKLALVVTVGEQAKAYLAPAAEERGCIVKTFLNPREAGEYVKAELKKQAIVLAKGSQNGVFAEEALKPLLADQADKKKLVRQSEYWIRIKRSQFAD